MERNQDQIDVSYRAFRFRTTKQGTRDTKIDVGDRFWKRIMLATSLKYLPPTQFIFQHRQVSSI